MVVGGGGEYGAGDGAVAGDRYVNGMRTAGWNRNWCCRG